MRKNIFKNIKGQDFSMNFQHILDFKVRKKLILQDCVSLRPLWAYGSDSAARRAPEKSKVGEVNLEVSLLPKS